MYAKLLICVDISILVTLVCSCSARSFLLVHLSNNLIIAVFWYVLVAIVRHDQLKSTFARLICGNLGSSNSRRRCEQLLSRYPSAECFQSLMSLETSEEHHQSNCDELTVTAVSSVEGDFVSSCIMGASHLPVS